MPNWIEKSHRWSLVLVVLGRGHVVSGLGFAWLIAIDEMMIERIRLRSKLTGKVDFINSV